MTDNTTYTATLTITSVGDSPEVSVNVSSEPSAVDRVVEGRGLPAAYSAMRDVQQFINMAGYRESFNMRDEEFFSLPECEQMKVIEEAANSAENTVVVNRMSIRRV